MGVVRGQDWGEVGPVPDDAPVAVSDAALSDLLNAGLWTDGRWAPGSVVALTGGDLCRTLGGRGWARPGVEATLLEVDVGEALLDGRLHWFVAHLVARPSRHPGRWWIAANAAYRGRWNMAPQAHPGDGLLDVIDASLGLGDVPEAWRRIRRGVHVPHPAIRQVRTEALQQTFERPAPVFVDGRAVGRVRDLAVRLRPGALRVAV